MKRETWHVVAYILQHFTTFYKFNFVMSYFWLGGGEPKCNLQFVTACCHGLLHFEGTDSSCEAEIINLMEHTCCI